jgi:hypothetical protein
MRQNFEKNGEKDREKEKKIRNRESPISQRTCSRRSSPARAALFTLLERWIKGVRTRSEWGACAVIAWGFTRTGAKRPNADYDGRSNVRMQKRTTRGRHLPRGLYRWKCPNNPQRAKDPRGCRPPAPNGARTSRDRFRPYVRQPLRLLQLRWPEDETGVPAGQSRIVALAHQEAALV